jgi:HD-GYP domain-containing protein (c-di-GMP phosphodiesterase class II)
MVMASVSAQVDRSQVGLRLLGALVRCLHTVALHEVDNAASREAIDVLGALLDGELRTRMAVELQLVGGLPFVNGVRLRLGEEHLETLVALRRYLEPLQVQEIAFGAGVGCEELRRFLHAFQKHRRGRRPQAILQEPLQPITLSATVSTPQVATSPEVLVRYYARLVVMLDHVITSQVPVRIERFRRVLQQLADASLGQESLLVGLTRFRRAERGGGQHGASVAVLTLLMARRLGVARALQMELALNGLFHDLGRGTALLGPEQEFDRAAHELLARRGPLKTALRLMQRPLQPGQLERMVAAHDCIQPLRSGPLQRPVGMAGRLLAVPCAFDLLTFPAPPHPGLPPDQALRLITSRAGTRFDPRVVRLFTSVAGFYPVGTLVRLSGGQLGVVMDVPAEPARSALPKVRVIQDSSRSVVDYVVDLAEPGQRLSILASLDSTEHDLNVPHFLFS